MVAALFLIAGAVWRFIDGLSAETSGIRNGIRVAVTIALCLGAARWSLGLGWPALWAGGCAAASIVLGCTKWQDATWQAIRFGGLAAVAVAPLGLGWTGTGYVLACAVAGTLYTGLEYADGRKWLQHWWLFQGGEAYARLPLGGAVIGGLALL